MRSVRVGLVALVASAPLVGHAQVPAATAPQVNPGIISNENRRNEQQLRELVDPNITTVPVTPTPVKPTVIAPSGGPKVRLNKVNFDPSTFITVAELDRIAAPYVGQAVDISDIQRIVKAVNDLFAEKGIVTAAAYLPPQDLKSGTLRIAIVEGKLGKVTTTGSNRLRTEFVTHVVPQAEGEVVDVPRLTQQIVMFNRTGVAQIQASLASGTTFGLTDINLAVVTPPALSMNVFVDNQGTESVGKHQGGFLIQGYSPLGIDDRLTVYGVGSQGNLDGNIAYNMPFNAYGGRIGASFVKGRIYVVRGPFANLDIKGQSQSASVNVAQPVFVNSNFYFLANGALSLIESQSKQEDVEVTNNRTLKKTGGFSVGYVSDTFAVNLSPTVSHAETYFKVAEAKQRFVAFNGTASASLRLPNGFLATTSGAFQMSLTPFIAGDQLFQIGGPTSVRGYQTGLFAASTGYYVNAEIHRNADFFSLPNLDVYAFYDRGSTYSVSPAVKTLHSVGAGLTYTYEQRLIAEASAGRPLARVVSKQPPVEVYFRVTLKLTSDDLNIFQ